MPLENIGIDFWPLPAFVRDNLGFLATKESFVVSDGILTKVERVFQYLSAAHQYTSVALFCFGV